MIHKGIDHTRKGVIFAILLGYALEICSGYGYSTVATIVTTGSGAIRGKQMKAEGTDVTVFLGIPYAEPPIGNQRFRKAIPKRSWQGVHDATEKPRPCIQYSAKDFQWISKVKPSEDCLYLNVWMPDRRNFFELEPTGKPVLVWIHGGGYFAGSSEIDVYDGASLAVQGNVIVVSLNYRLGVFGFLTLGTEDCPGNMGMYDQYLAIKWVKNNIRQFGGDPDRITLFGQSAGAVSVGLHLISPLSRDLFRRVIMQSGSPYHQVFATNPSIMIHASNIFATAAGCSLTSKKEVVDCLRKRDALQLAIAESYMLQKAPFAFLPIYGDDFMPVNPVAAINKGDFKHTEILIGSNRDEGALFLHYIMPELFGSHMAPNISVEQAKMLIFGLFQNSTNPPPQVIVDFYMKDASDDDPVKTRKSVYESFGDFVFHCPAVFFAEKLAEAREVFFYYFTHRSSNSHWGDWMGVTHFEEVPFVFGDPIRNSTAYSSEERSFSQSIMQKWATFAKSGVPIASEKEEHPRFTHSNPLYLELNPKWKEIGKVPHSRACDFWRPYFQPRNL